MDIMSLTRIMLGNRSKDTRLIDVRFPSMMGDTNRTMTVQELKENYRDYLIIDPRVGEQIDIVKLDNLEDIKEVVVMPHISGGNTLRSCMVR